LSNDIQLDISKKNLRFAAPHC